MFREFANKEYGRGNNLTIAVIDIKLQFLPKIHKKLDNLPGDHRIEIASEVLENNQFN